MLSSEEIIRTVEMLKNENLDVRTVTLGISLRDCVSASVEDLAHGFAGKSSIMPKTWSSRATASPKNTGSRS